MKIMIHVLIRTFLGCIIIACLLIGVVQPIFTQHKEQQQNLITDECVGLLATGSVTKDQRSIFWKNRHATVPNQQPIYFQGTHYRFFGIGNPGDTTNGECRMGMNQQGLAIGNLLVGDDLIVNWTYISDHNGTNSDDTMEKVLGNYSTVAAATLWVAQHGHFGSQTGFQYGIVSAEVGVGALVSIDCQGHSNITWVNNTHLEFANAFVCNGDIDPDHTDLRARQIVNDIIQNSNSSEGDSLINWQDACQRLAKDTHRKEYGSTTYSYVNEISNEMAYSSMVVVGGNTSFNNSLNIAWVNFGKTTQIGLFLPISAAYLQSSTDIPSSFTQNNGIQPYVDVKYQYATAGSNHFNCSRVRQIKEYAFYNENLTFRNYDTLMESIMNASNEAEAKTRIRTYVEHADSTALSGYASNTSIVVNVSRPEKGLYINNKRIIPFKFIPSNAIIIIKNIEVDATVVGGGVVDRVEFSVDGVLKETDTTAPYSWLWDEKTPLHPRHLITVTVYDTEGYHTNRELSVIKLL